MTKKYKPDNNYYYDFDDMAEKKGYKVYKPNIGSLGRAIMAAGKKYKQAEWLNNQLDIFFKAYRKNKKNELFKRNSRKAALSNDEFKPREGLRGSKQNNELNSEL